MDINIKNLNLSIIIPGIKNEELKYNSVSKNSETDKEDGIYLIYEGGHAEKFTGDNYKDNVKYIGLKHKDVQFAISLTEHDGVKLLADESNEESGDEVYFERECDAIFDLDGKRNTEQLIKRNPKLENLLKGGEYIPSLGQLNLMAHYKDGINDALDYVGAEMLSSAWYWSSSVSSRYYGWTVDFSNGLTNNYYQYDSGRLRAVEAFSF